MKRERNKLVLMLACLALVGLMLTACVASPGYAPATPTAVDPDDSDDEEDEDGVG